MFALTAIFCLSCFLVRNSIIRSTRVACHWPYARAHDIGEHCPTRSIPSVMAVCGAEPLQVSQQSRCCALIPSQACDPMLSRMCVLALNHMPWEPYTLRRISCEQVSRITSHTMLLDIQSRYRGISIVHSPVDFLYIK